MLKRNEAIQIFNAALAAVDPYQAVLNSVCVEANKLHLADAIYDLNLFNKIIVIGAGKATARMAVALENLLAQRISAGLIVVKEGHTAPLNIIRQIEASHPLPNQAGATGTQEILALAQGADAQTLVICLLSGGASALLLAPVEGITLNDKQQLTQLLLQSGADINELNCVRKHISAVKGGRLARAFYPAQMLTLILSDVMGDPLEVIASGPTAADSTSFDDAWKVIEKYQLQQKIPPSVLQYLQQGREGQVVDTIKQGDVCLQSVRNVIVGNNFLALEAARKQAIQLGFESKIIKTNLHGEARVAAHWLAQAAREALEKMQAGERCCLLSGGETTVTVTGSGMGGRNQELALAFALEIEGLPGVGLLSAATDGSDGANDAAGGWVHGHTVALAKRFGLEPDEYLSANNSYEFFQQFDVASGEHTHLITDPTGTNVMDVQIMLLEK